jgi:hypothetical protein
VNATQARIDLDDTQALLAADREALLRAASTAGAQVRAAAAALDEGALDALRSDDRPRTVIWVAGRGTAETAGTMLAATLGSWAAAPIVVVAEAPPWIGALDVLIVAGDDPGDPALVGAAASGVRRGARVVVAAPYEGPLRDITAGRVAVLEPRLPVADEFGLCRYLAAGLAALQSVDPKLGVDLAALADELDAEALRNSASREVFTNPAKALVERMSRRRVVLAGDCAATLALARHGSSVLLDRASGGRRHRARGHLGGATHGRGFGVRRPGGGFVSRRGDRRPGRRAAAGAGVDAGCRALRRGVSGRSA